MTPPVPVAARSAAASAPGAADAASPFEPVWLVEATYAPDAAETRLPVRAEHVARLRELLAAGTLAEAGAFADVSASLMIVRAESEAAALAIFADDVYIRAGVWVELRARAFGRVRQD
jgi:uncharacterized protein YciI